MNLTGGGQLAAARRSASGQHVWSMCIGIALLLIVTLFSRGPAPWRTEVLNDEMLHLRSWRNRYGTDSIFPIFMARLESLPPSSMNRRLMRIYETGPVAQRGFIILVDGHPPLFPAAMESIAAATNSNLYAQRLVSTFASLASVVAAFLLGQKLRDDALGLCIATVFCISATCQYFAGSARPYATSELVILLAVLAFVDDSIRRPSSPRRFLLFAFLAQSIQWFNWVPVGILVASALVRRRNAGMPMRVLVRQIAWYCAGSIALLFYMYLQTRNPTLSGRLRPRGLAEFWFDFTAASPLSHLGRFGSIGFTIAGALTIVLALGGVVSLLRDHPTAERYHAVGWPLSIALAMCGAMMLIAPTGVRFLVPFMVFPCIFAGVALRELGRTPHGAALLAILLLLSMGSLSVAAPVNPYARHFREDEPYSPFANALRANLQPGDIWIAFPYFFADPLFRYAQLPPPLQPQSNAQMAEALAQTRPGHSCFILTGGQIAAQFPQLRSARVILGSTDGMELLRVSP